MSRSGSVDILSSTVTVARPIRAVLGVNSGESAVAMAGVGLVRLAQVALEVAQPRATLPQVV